MAHLAHVTPRGTFKGTNEATMDGRKVQRMELQTSWRLKRHRKTMISKGCTGIMFSAKREELSKPMAELRKNASRPSLVFSKRPRVRLLQARQKDLQRTGSVESTAKGCGRCSFSVPGCCGCVRCCACFARFVRWCKFFQIGFDLK